MHFMHALWSDWITPADPLLELAGALCQPFQVLDQVRQLESWCGERLRELEQQTWDHAEALAERMTLAYGVLAQACGLFLEAPEEGAEDLHEVLHVAAAAIADVRVSLEGQRETQALFA